MAKVKYVIMEVSYDDTIDVVPIVFPTALIHKEMYRAMKNSYCGILSNRVGAHSLKFEAVSAGFVYFNSSQVLTPDSIRIEGRSESLNLDSRIKDSEIIFNMLTRDKQITYPANSRSNESLEPKDIDKILRSFGNG